MKARCDRCGIEGTKETLDHTRDGGWYCLYPWDACEKRRKLNEAQAAKDARRAAWPT